MKLNLKNLPIVAEIGRRAELALARLALREAGTLLRAAAPLVEQAGEKLQHLSEHPNLKASSPFFHV